MSFPVHANEILVIGDSWAEPIGRKLRKVLTEQGHLDIPVHTTPYWGGPRNLDSADGRSAISSWLEQHPNANYLYMQMGQNNWLCCWTRDMIGSEEEDGLFTSIIDHTDNVLAYIRSIRPGIKVLWTTGEYFRPHHLGTPAEVNASHDLLASLAEEYAADKGPDLVFLNWSGLFQLHYGFDGVQHTTYDPDFEIPAGDPSLPDPQYPSPAQAYPSNTPAHPKPVAYQVMAQKLYDEYFDQALNGVSFQINAGLNDAWYNPQTAGQGFLISVLPDLQQIFLAWFTYDTDRPASHATAVLGEPGHRWLTAQGPYSGDTATLTAYLTEGGRFDSADPVPFTDPLGVGEIQIEFVGCDEGLLSYRFDLPRREGEIPIQRIVKDNEALCEALAGAD